MTVANENRGDYLPKIEMMADDVIWKKTTKTSRIEFKPSFAIDRIEVAFQGLKQEGGSYRQTSLIRVYVTVDEALWLVYKIRNGAKTDEKGVLYKAPPAGTPAARLNARGIGRNGYAEYRSFQVSKGTKGWVFTGFACDGVENEYGLFSPHKDKNGNMTGLTKSSVALTGKELLALSYALETAINGYKMTQWFLLGFKEHFVADDDYDAPAQTEPKAVPAAAPAPAPVKPAANSVPTEELSEDDIDFGDDVPEAPVPEPKQEAPKKKAPAKKQEPEKSSENFDGYDFGEDDLPW